MKIGYYPGCALTSGSSSAEYGISVKETAKAFGVDLVEIDDWSCCGASSAHQTNHLLGIALSARNITLATNEGFEDVLVPCPACSLRFITAQKDIAKDDELRKKIEDAIEMPYNDGITALNYLQFVQKYGADALKENAKKTAPDLKVVCYYGCLLVRPPKVVEFDDPNNPMVMDDILKSIGIEPLEWEYKTECCGGGLSLSRADVVTKLTGDITNNAREAGADAIVVSCPLCQANLDLRQPGRKLPIVYLSELIGLAMGLNNMDSALNKHLIGTGKVSKAFS